MNRHISHRAAWWFTAAACLSFAVWAVFTTFTLQLPGHPWCSVAAAIALFVTFFAWAGTSETTMRSVSLAIGLWEVSVFIAVLSAALFGGAGQPFPNFAIVIALVPTGLLGVVVVLSGGYNWLHHLAAEARRPPTPAIKH